MRSLFVDNLNVARRFLLALEQGATGERLSEFLTDDVTAEEFPNRLNPAGAQRDAPALKLAFERGRRLLTSQRYEVVSDVATGDRVALEVRWTGTLAMAVPPWPEGAQMRARFAIFMDLRDGRIARMRNYDCFEPPPTG